MKVSFIIPKLIFILWNFVEFGKGEEWIEVIKKELDLLRTPLPSGLEKLIVRIDTDSYYDLSAFQISELDDILVENDFPDELKNKIRALLWADTITFQGFHFTKMTGTASLFEIAGVARKIQNQVDLFYFASTSIAILKPQMEIVKVKKCENFLKFFEINCEWVNQNNPRPLTIHEINIIADTLKSRAYNGIYVAFNTQSSLSYGSNDESVTVSKSFSKNNYFYQVNQIRNKEIDKILIAYKTDEFVKKALSLNPADFIKAIQVDNFYSLVEKDIEKFFENFVNNINLCDHQIVYIHTLLKSLINSTIQDKSTLVFSFTNKDKILDLFYIFLSYEKHDNRYSITLKKRKTNVLMDADILLYKLNGGKLNFLIDNSSDQKDFQDNYIPLMNIFELICQSS